MEPKKMYIDGEWVTGSMEKPFDVINPATGEVLAQVLSLIHISEPTRLDARSRMPSSA